MSDEVVRLRGVGVRRGGSMLLRDVDWTVHDDERWVVIGPNGAGKTTLLQVVASQLFPTEGSAEILGSRLGETDVFELRPRIGLASASLADRVPPAEKVIDLVLTASYAIVGRWKEDYESSDVTRAVELLDALGCAHLIRRRFTTLSEGERKRVQIARALMPDPELLLLDEPAAGLDLGGREDLLQRIAMLARDPLAPTMVMVTHHVEEVPEDFTHAMLLRRGSVLAAGPVPEVLTEANLSKCFGIPLIVERHGSRWAARAVRSTSWPLGRACRCGWLVSGGVGSGCAGYKLACAPSGTCREGGPGRDRHRRRRDVADVRGHRHPGRPPGRGGHRAGRGGGHGGHPGRHGGAHRPVHGQPGARPGRAPRGGQGHRGQGPGDRGAAGRETGGGRRTGHTGLTGPSPPPREQTCPAGH